MPDIQNAVLTISMDVFYSLSFYAPLIICVSMSLFSMFTSSWPKLGFYFLWILVITFIRILVFKGIGTKIDENLPSRCLIGVTEIFIPQDITYSTYILSFTLMYLIMPMIMISSQNKINAINYGVLGFFIFYIILDLGIKLRLSCLNNLFSGLVLGDILSGLFLGGIIAGPIMYGTNLKKYLYINEINSNKEVCSLPNKQQFKCQVYKDGTLVGNI
jgi:hypothetical protein